MTVEVVTELPAVENPLKLAERLANPSIIYIPEINQLMEKFLTLHRQKTFAIEPSSGFERLPESRIMKGPNGVNRSTLLVPQSYSAFFAESNWAVPEETESRETVIHFVSSVVALLKDCKLNLELPEDRREVIGRILRQTDEPACLQKLQNVFRESENDLGRELLS